ncbi:Transcriptional repressor [Candidatus Hydrogenisulfobacillus filiaventi]|uniref:Transcriptional repressor n=1 Tax=Candidatus Hydrogenisulfobacillus filiaventi TaxID=2707344 RepID=A0A6F8ZEP2_9FIRM|nr:Fur family transcriptional regulator [Bacillota bacterium]CAB1128113.1 Transcriptional repressor [Candidatus Hydrogenisulfobacillus filiaventi]
MADAEEKPSRSGAEQLLASTLREHGLRVTPDRLQLFRTLEAASAPLSITEISKRMEPLGINQATVYRILERFTAISVTHSVLLPHGVVAYELVPPFAEHHHHLVCSRCGRVINFYNPELDQAIQAVAKNYGFTVTSHMVEVHGLCTECAKAHREKKTAR